jgi:hypothetical protein
MVYLPQAVDDGGMIAPTQEASYLCHPLVGIFSQEVHSDVTSLSDLLNTTLAS